MLAVVGKRLIPKVGPTIAKSALQNGQDALSGKKLEQAIKKSTQLNRDEILNSKCNTKWIIQETEWWKRDEHMTESQ